MITNDNSKTAQHKAPKHVCVFQVSALKNKVWSVGITILFYSNIL